MKTLKDLCIDHDYYSSDSNYYSNEARSEWSNFSEFYEEFHDADIDMNLIFRWDIHQRENSKTYRAEIFMIHQRKGIYHPHIINFIHEEEAQMFVDLVTKHWEKLFSIWNPISNK